MSPTQPKNDTKLLVAVAGAVVTVAAGLALLAGFSGGPAESTASAVANSPSSRPAPVKPVEPAVSLASYHREPEPETPESPRTPPEPMANEPDEAIVNVAACTDDCVALGLESWHGRDYERAAGFFASEVDQRADRPWTTYMLGLSLWKSGRLEEAAAALASSGTLDPASTRAWINLARVHNDREDYEAALEAAAVAVGIDPFDPTALFLEGRSLRNLGRVEEALDRLEKSVSVDPRNGFVQNLVGLIHLQQGSAEAAIAPLEQAAALEPGVAYVQNNLGMAYELTGRRDDAIAAYRRAVESDPSHGKAHTNLARLEPIATPDAETVVELAAAGDVEPTEEGRP